MKRCNCGEPIPKNSFSDLCEKCEAKDVVGRGIGGGEYIQNPQEGRDFTDDSGPGLRKKREKRDKKGQR